MLSSAVVLKGEFTGLGRQLPLDFFDDFVVALTNPSSWPFDRLQVGAGGGTAIVTGRRWSQTGEGEADAGDRFRDGVRGGGPGDAVELIFGVLAFFAVPAFSAMAAPAT